MANQLKPLKMGTYHPVGTDMHMAGHQFKVASVDHKNQSYTLQHAVTGHKTQHSFAKLHQAFPPEMTKFIQDKIRLVKAILETLKKG